MSQFLANNIADKELSKQAYSQLESIRAIKAEAVTRYFDTIKEQLVNVAERRETVNAMDAFVRSFKTLASREGLDTPEATRRIKNELNDFYNNQFAAEYSRRNEGDTVNATQLLDQISPNALAAQYLYIQKNANLLGEKHLLESAEGKASYHRMHERYHYDFKSFIERFGFYDIFLVPPALLQRHCMMIKNSKAF